VNAAKTGGGAVAAAPLVNVTPYGTWCVVNTEMTVCATYLPPAAAPNGAVVGFTFVCVLRLLSIAAFAYYVVRELISRIEVGLQPCMSLLNIADLLSFLRIFCWCTGHSLQACSKGVARGEPIKPCFFQQATVLCWRALVDAHSMVPEAFFYTHT
jgi:hypothetical protein